MAEVSQRFGCGLHRLLRSAYAVTSHTGNKCSALSVRVVHVLSGAPLPKTQDDRASGAGSWNRPACESGEGGRPVTSGADLYSGPNGKKHRALLHTESLFLLKTVPESVGVCKRNDAERPAGPRVHAATRNGSDRVPSAGGRGPRRGQARPFHTCYDYGAASRVKPSCGGLSRAYHHSGAAAPDTPLYQSKRGYYDILEVSPTATQTQIKTAYYKQSFLYHPDKNAGSDEATFRFSQISEAYNVLGNKALRRKYDRGVLGPSDLHGAGRPPSSPARDAPSRAAGQQQARGRHSPTTGPHADPVFDFDAFYRAHYGEQLQRERFLRARREQILKKQEKMLKGWKLARMTEIAVGAMLATAVAILFSLGSNK